MNCPVCQSASIRNKFALTDSAVVCRCANCQLEFVTPQIDDRELRELYSQAYYTAWGMEQNKEDNDALKAMKTATFLLRLDLIRRHKTGGKILDVGCATGYFLEAARRMEFECFGVELSEYAASVAKQTFGHQNIFCGTLEQCTFAEANFDVIAMSDFIEHVRSPDQTLGKASALLTEDGVIMITTPDTQSLSHYFMGQHWPHYKLEHFYYFNKESIEFLAKRCGLHVAHYERSRKALNMSYLKSQFTAYRHWLLSPATRMLHTLFPKKLSARSFRISLGEMTVLLRKNKRTNH